MGRRCFHSNCSDLPRAIWLLVFAIAVMGGVMIGEVTRGDQ
jgi:hypothetical protein